MKQREIKFRAWNKKEKVFGFFNLENYAIGADGCCDSVRAFINTWRWQKGASGEMGNYFSFEIDQSEISYYNYQQFTGLKDKNGKEIYEGDLIKDKNDSIIEIKHDYYLLYNLERHQGIFEIVGNIYENPELLKN
jgi:uncharacterized phage protein (TIGR01671 family)